MKVITLLGLPGSGKTTLSNQMARDGVGIWESGDFIRANKLMKGDKLEYLPQVDEAVHRIMQGKNLERYGAIVISGYPRQVYQHHLLNLWCQMYGHDLISVVIGVKDEVAAERLRDRGRADDTEEGIAIRISEQGAVLGEICMSSKGTFVVLDGDKEPDEVRDELYGVLRTAFNIKIGENNGR